MRTHIITFKNFRSYIALPRREQRWHLSIVCVLLSVAIVCYHLPAHLYADENRQEDAVNPLAIAALSPRTDVLCIGSSHVWAGIRPERYSMEVMNLASAGLNYSCAEVLLKKYLPRVPNLRVVVLELDETPLISDTVGHWTEHIKPALDLGLNPAELPARTVSQKIQLVSAGYFSPILTRPRVTPRDWEKSSAKLISQKQFLRERYSPGFVRIDHVITLPYDQRFAFDALTSLAEDDWVVNENLKALQRTVEMLEQRGIKIVLLRLPRHPLYWKNWPALLQARWRQLHGFIRIRYDSNPRISIWDYGASPQFINHDFADDHHLNIYGADKLARLLDGKLRALCDSASSDRQQVTRRER